MPDLHRKKLLFNDFEKLKEELYSIVKLVKKKHLNKLKEMPNIRMFGKGSISSKLWKYYNLFNFNQPMLSELCSEIKSEFTERFAPQENYYISAWVNIHKKGEHLVWHSHWEKEYDSYHGYFGVEVEPSNTTYKFCDVEDLYINKNQNGNIFINKSENDRHCVSPWEEDFDRISVAFDIIPYRTILANGGERFNEASMIPFYIHE